MAGHKMTKKGMAMKKPGKMRKGGAMKKKMKMPGGMQGGGSTDFISVDEYERQSGLKKKKMPLDNKAISVEEFERQTPRGLPPAKKTTKRKKTTIPTSTSEKRPTSRGKAVMRNKGGTIKKPGKMQKGGTIKKPGGMKEGGTVKAMKKPSTKNSGLYGR